MKGSMPGPRTEEENMKLISKAELWRVNDRRRDQLTAEVRRKIGAADQEIRQGYAELQKSRQAQGQRRIMRPNL
jgi:hypothetical protein